jgi:hypothetical protein
MVLFSTRASFTSATHVSSTIFGSHVCAKMESFCMWVAMQGRILFVHFGPAMMYFRSLSAAQRSLDAKTRARPSRGGGARAAGQGLSWAVAARRGPAAGQALPPTQRTAASQTQPPAGVSAVRRFPQIRAVTHEEARPRKRAAASARRQTVRQRRRGGGGRKAGGGGRCGRRPIGRCRRATRRGGGARGACARQRCARGAQRGVRQQRRSRRRHARPAAGSRVLPAPSTRPCAPASAALRRP